MILVAVGRRGQRLHRRPERRAVQARARAARHGYQVGSTSPFGTRRALRVFVEASMLELPRILINRGRHGDLVGIAPSALVETLGERPLRCAL